MPRHLGFLYKWLPVLVVMGMLFFPSHLAWGQGFVNGSIAGTVTDSTGAVIPNVALTLANMGTTAKSDTHSDAAGFFQFLDLPPGNYSLSAEATGFSKFVREPIVVLQNSGIHIDVALQVGAMTQTVEVTAETPLLQSETSSLGQVIETREVNELPLNGRNPLALVALVPGVVPQGDFGGSGVTQNPFAAGNIQISGGAANQSAGYLDGAPLNSPQYINLWVLLPQQEAIQEFKVQTDAMSAQYDRFAGGIVSFTTKSGTNSVHGSAYEFLRNNVLNANNFFDNAEGLAVPSFKQNQFGGVVGGPLYIPHLYDGRNKTFWFAGYDGFRLIQGNALLLSVPTAAFDQGDFSKLVDANGNQIPIYDPSSTCGVNGNPACAVDSSGNPIYVRQQASYNGVMNVIPPNRVDPTAKLFSALWAPQNLAGVQGGYINNWAGNAGQGGGVNEFTTRVDQNVSDKQRIFARYTIDKWYNSEVDPFGTHAYPIWTGVPETYKEQSAVFDDSYSLSPTKIIDVSLGYLRNHYLRTPVTIGSDQCKWGPDWCAFNTELDYPTLPNLTVSGISSFSFGEDGSVIIDDTDDWILAPNMTIIKGKHNIKFGADLRMDRFSYYQVNDTDPGFSFDVGFTKQGPAATTGGFGYASLMYGAPASGDVGKHQPTSAQQLYRAFYVQDDIHATSRLTLNLGFRYNQEGPNSERYNRISVFLPNVQNPLTVGTTEPANGFLALVDSSAWAPRTHIGLDKHMFAPRVGFAYRLKGDTVVRGAFGIFWLPIGNAWGEDPANDAITSFYTPYAASVNGGLTPYNSLSNPFPNNGVRSSPGRSPSYAQTLFGTGIYGQTPTSVTAYVQQWNVGVQRTWKGGIFMDLAYAGTSGRHLGNEFPIDVLPDQDKTTYGNALFGQVPNPYYGIIQNGGLIGPTVSLNQTLLPYPQYNGVNDEEWGYNSDYNSMQLKVQKRFSSGQTFLLAYTISKFFSDAEPTTTWLDAAGAAGYQDYNNIKADRSLSSFDVPQRLVLSYVLDLPVGHGKRFLHDTTGVVNKLVEGWGIQGITTFQRGYPIFLGDNDNTSVNGGQRPNYNASAAGCQNSPALAGRSEARLGEWFNTGCFLQPATFTFGNVGRVMPNIRWDGIDNWDLAFVKNTGITADDRVRVQFRAEMFDMFNHPQFGPPGNSFGSGSFGIVSEQVNNPRLIQFGLKLYF